MKNKSIWMGLAVLAIFCSDVSVASTLPNDACRNDVRRTFYEHDRRDPLKGLVTINNDTIFVAHNRQISKTTDGTAWTSVCAFPADFGNVIRIHSLGTHLAIQEETRSADTQHSKGRVFVLNLRDGEFSEINAGENHNWIQDVSRNNPSVFYLNSHSHQSGESVETCFVYNILTGALQTIASGPRLGNPMFGEDGNVKYFVNQSHQGPQTVIPVSADGALLPPIYEQNDPNRVLLGFDPSTNTIQEARLHAASGRWLPWVWKKEEFAETQICLWPNCPGSVRHFTVLKDGTIMCNVRMPDRSVVYYVKQATPPTKLGRDVDLILSPLAGREVIQGPELKGADDLPLEFRLVTSDGPIISVLNVLRSDDAEPAITERLSFDYNSIGAAAGAATVA